MGPGRGGEGVVRCVEIFQYRYIYVMSLNSNGLVNVIINDLYLQRLHKKRKS